MKNLATRVLFVLRKYFLRILIFSIVVLLAFCLWSYKESPRSTSVVLTFTYPNASEGLFPNGSYFNAYDIFTDDIIENGIRNAGLEEMVNTGKIADEISILPRSNASLLTTQFVVTYNAKRDDQLGAVSAEGLLHSIVYAYIDHFHNTYSNDQLVLNLDVMDEEKMEYIDYVKYYNSALNQLKKYLRSQQDNNKDFVSSDGTTFQELINILERYRLTSLKEIEAIITERGVTHDRNAYIARLNYELWDKSNTYTLNRNMQEIYNNILQDYESELTSVVFVPALDSNREFYMSKTKVGIDTYSLKVTNYEEASEEIKRQIDQTSQNISTIKDPKNISEAAVNAQRVDRSLAALKEQIDATMSKIRVVEKEYSKYKNHNYVTMTPVVPEFTERIGLRSAILFTVIMDVVLVTILAFLKREKNASEEVERY